MATPAVATAMRFKYDVALQSRPDQPCPCLRKYRARAVRGYRYMKREATERDFLPVAILDGAKPKDKCGRYALSFFMSVQEARDRFRDLADRLGDEARVYERYGDHIGALDLQPTDGVCCDPNGQGHFDLHEAHDAVLHTRVMGYDPTEPAADIGDGT